MLVIDENLPEDQRALLLKKGIRVRAVGREVAFSGATDENLLPLFHRIQNVTFFTLDRHFFRRDWVHPKYSLVWLDITRKEAAEFIQRFLKHRCFNTQAKRRGTVVRVARSGLHFWTKTEQRLQSTGWYAR
jgi:hypothetical protein